MSKLSLLVALALSISALGHPTSGKCEPKDIGGALTPKPPSAHKHGWRNHSPHHSWGYGPPALSSQTLESSSAPTVSTIEISTSDVTSTTAASTTTSELAYPTTTSTSGNVESSTSNTVTPTTPAPTTSSSTAVATTSSSPPIETFSIVPPTTSSDVPTPTTSTTPSPPISTPGNDYGGGNATEIQMYLDAHNSFRAKYRAPALTWNATLASKALEWAKNCKFEHSGGKLGPFGENLAAATGEYPIAEGVKAWTDESTSYDPNNPSYSHFTQVVWVATTQLGCAYNMCAGGTIFPEEYGNTRYHVCEYAEQGNVVGETKQNVLV